jgi:amidohydrolase
MAAADRWALTIKGQGGHGALPHETADPVAAMVQIVSTLQTIVSRNVSPLETAVVSVGTIDAGTAFNIIPGQVHLTGTIRTFEAAVRERVVKRMQDICKGVAAAMNVEADLEVAVLVPAVVNEPAAARLVQQVAEQVLGSDQIQRDYRTMVSEDMSYFLQQVPGCFFYLGASNAERGLDYGHHHPRFDFDEAVLPLGVAILAQSAVRFLTSDGTD